jgi:hypothetical protein
LCSPRTKGKNGREAVDGDLLIGSAASGLDWWESTSPARQQLWYDAFYGIREFFKDINFEPVNYCDFHYDNVFGLYFAQRHPWKSNTIKLTNYTGTTNSKDYQNSDALEGFSMVSSSKLQGFGWLHNRSHYWSNLIDENSCTKSMVEGTAPWVDPVVIRPNDDDLTASVRPIDLNDDYIKVRHLKRGKRYIIRYYHPQTNDWIGEKKGSLFQLDLDFSIIKWCKIPRDLPTELRISG